MFEDKKELKELAEKINRRCQDAKERIQEARAILLDVGDMYLEGRNKCESDQEFGRFCMSIEFGYSQQDAHKLMTLANNRSRVLAISEQMESKAVSPFRWMEAVEKSIKAVGAKELTKPKASTNMLVDDKEAITKANEVSQQPKKPETKQKKEQTDGLKARSIFRKQFPKETALIDKAYKAAVYNGKKQYRYEKEFVLVAAKLEELGRKPVNARFNNDFGPHFIFNLPKAGAFSSMRGNFSKPTVTAIAQNLDLLQELEKACDEANDRSSGFCNKWWNDKVEKPESKDQNIVTPEEWLKLTSMKQTEEKKAARTGYKVESIKAFGVIVWDEKDSISYDIAWNAYTYWDVLDRTMRKADPNPDSRGMFYMGMNMYFNTICPSGANTIIQRIGIAMRNNPDKERECYAAPELTNT
jgi:hypothetical protein